MGGRERKDRVPPLGRAGATLGLQLPGTSRTSMNRQLAGSPHGAVRPPAWSQPGRAPPSATADRSWLLPPRRVLHGADLKLPPFVVFLAVAKLSDGSTRQV